MSPESANILLQGVVYRVQLGVQPDAFRPTANGASVTDERVLAQLYAATKSLTYVAGVTRNQTDAQFVASYVQPTRDLLAALEGIVGLSKVRDFLGEVAGNAVAIYLRPDALVLDAGQLASSYALDPARFSDSGAATIAGPQLLYTQASGLLRWDADGTGTGAADTIAVLATRPALSAADIVVFA